MCDYLYAPFSFFAAGVYSSNIFGGAPIFERSSGLALEVRFQILFVICSFMHRDVDSQKETSYFGPKLIVSESNTRFKRCLLK